MSIEQQQQQQQQHTLLFCDKYKIQENSIKKINLIKQKHYSE